MAQIMTEQFAATASKPKERLFAIVTGTLGNILEWYDFAVYAFLVPVLSKVFFPNNTETDALLLSLAVFGSGFVSRPLGAVLFGIYGDKLGRRTILALIMMLMAATTFAIGLLPSAAEAGIVAPVLLVALRLFQGLASGGEWAGSASYIIEYAPENRRGLFGSWHIAGVAGGILIGSAVVGMLNACMTKEGILDWGWRIPFFLGIIVGIVGIVMRWKIADTPAFVDAKRRGDIVRTPLRTAIRTNWRAMLKVFGLTVNQAIGSYLVLTYMPTYYISVLKMEPAKALMIGSIGLVLFIIALPLMGRLSDQYGRKPFLLTGCIAFLVLSIPLFMMMKSAQWESVLAAQCMLILILASFCAPMTAAFAELFPTSIRYTGVSVSYNIAQTIFGGFAPFIAQWLIKMTGNSLAPTFYLMAGAVLSLVVLLRVKETAFEKLQ